MSKNVLVKSEVYSHISPLKFQPSQFFQFQEFHNNLSINHIIQSDTEFIFDN
jgi:hypothetical protein